jgi:hypothetical protein
MKITIPVSAGELMDKITILEIKSLKVKDKKKLLHIKYELNLLQKKHNGLKINSASKIKLNSLKKQLLKINTSLWNTEDAIRKLESNKDFGKLFISNARSVYIKNDKRFEIKNKINILLDSSLKEVKEYKK